MAHLLVITEDEMDAEIDADAEQHGCQGDRDEIQMPDHEGGEPNRPGHAEEQRDHGQQGSFDFSKTDRENKRDEDQADQGGACPVTGDRVALVMQQDGQPGHPNSQGSRGRSELIDDLSQADDHRTGIDELLTVSSGLGGHQANIGAYCRIDVPLTLQKQPEIVDRLLVLSGCQRFPYGNIGSSTAGLQGVVQIVEQLEQDLAAGTLVGSP